MITAVAMVSISKCQSVIEALTLRFLLVDSGSNAQHDGHSCVSAMEQIW